MKIMLTSGYNGSKHSLAVLELLRRKGVVVDRCLVVKAFSWKRLKYYYRQLDFKEFKKKLNDRILFNYVNKETISDEVKLVNDFLIEENIKTSTISSYCVTHNIDCLKVNSLNAENALEFARDIDLVIYTGGGIVGKKFIANAKTGVLNCHAAQLPKMRGSNVGEWSILKDVKMCNSLHFLVRKIDLGPILAVKEHDFSNCNSINKIRGLSTIYTIKDLVETTLNIQKGDYALTDQELNQGRQYYVMHPIIKSIVNQKLQS